MKSQLPFKYELRKDELNATMPKKVSSLQYESDAAGRYRIRTYLLCSISFLASSTTRRTSGKHHLPRGCFVGHWQVPLFFSLLIRSNISELPLLV
jgi:hypothetical protein